MATTLRHRGTGRVSKLAWNEDPAILARMAEVVRLHGAGKPLAEVAIEIGVSRRTAYDDWDHAKELYSEGAVDAVRQHVAELYALLSLQQKAYEEANANSINRGSILNAMRQTIETISKLDGSFESKAKIEIAGTEGVRFTLQIDNAKENVDADSSDTGAAG